MGKMGLLFIESDLLHFLYIEVLFIESDLLHFFYIEVPFKAGLTVFLLPWF